MTTHPLSRKAMIAYGFGDFSQNILFQVVSFHLLFYLTETVGLSAAFVGTTFLIARFWDAFNDPLMGYISSRTRTRWGSYRSYLLWGIPGMVGATYWLFAVPSAEEGGQVYFVVAYLLFGMAFTLYNIPYGAMTAVITNDYQERGKLTGFRMTFAALGGIVGATCFLPIVEWAGGGSEGYRWAGVIFAALVLLTVTPTFLFVRERIKVSPTDLPTISRIRDLLGSNTPFWLLCLVFGLVYCAYALFASSIPYAATYLYGDPGMTSPLILTLLSVMAVAIPFWTWLGTKTDKKTVFLIGALFFLTSFCLLGILPLNADPLWVYLIFGIKGIGYGAGAYTSWALIPDTVEYGMWKSGKQAAGITYGVYGVFFKLGLGLGAASAGWILASVGYHQGMESTESLQQGIKWSIAWLPLILSGLGWLVLTRYPITAGFHANMLSDIAAKEKKSKRV